MAFLEHNAGLEAKTIVEYFQRNYPAWFGDGQLRTFQRKVKLWRATEGAPKGVFFSIGRSPGYPC